MVPGVNAAETLFVCDPIPGFVPPHDEHGFPLPPPCDYFAETSEGLRVDRHPQILFALEPKLWATYVRFRDTGQRDLSLVDRARMSAFELRLWLDLCEYEGRKMLARAEADAAEAAKALENEDMTPPARRFATMRSLRGGRR